MELKISTSNCYILSMIAYKETDARSEGKVEILLGKDLRDWEKILLRDKHIDKLFEQGRCQAGKLRRMLKRGGSNRLPVDLSFVFQ